MFALLFLLTTACGAYASYWLSLNLIEPLLAQQGKYLDRPKIIAITIIGTLIYVVNFFLWIVIVALIYLYRYFKRDH